MFFFQRVNLAKRTLFLKKIVNKQLKAKLKEVTCKTTPMTFDERIQKIKEIHSGWINNFRLANIQGKLKELDGWLRNRLRYCIWSRIRREKKRERKRKKLIRLGVNPVDAFRWSRSRLGGCPAIAQSPILNTTITVRLLSQRGYESMFDWYQKAVPYKFTPSLFPTVWWTAQYSLSRFLSGWSVRWVVWEVLRGANASRQPTRLAPFFYFLSVS